MPRSASRWLWPEICTHTDTNRGPILVESNFGGGMFVKLLEPVLRRIYPRVVEEVRSTGQKERRIIDTPEPVLNQYRLVVDAALMKADPKYQLFHQLARITRDRGALRHDDRLDAIAMSVAYWTEWLSRDITKEEAVEPSNLWSLSTAASKNASWVIHISYRTTSITINP